MRPHGRTRAKNSRSAALSFGPAQPTIKARGDIRCGGRSGAVRRQARAERATALVALDDALAARGLEILAHLIGLVAVREWPEHCAKQRTAVAEIDALDGRLIIAEHIAVFGLQLLP